MREDTNKLRWEWCEIFSFYLRFFLRFGRETSDCARCPLFHTHVCVHIYRRIREIWLMARSERDKAIARSSVPWATESNYPPAWCLGGLFVYLCVCVCVWWLRVCACMCAWRREYLAPPPFWLFLPPPQKRKKYPLKISKKSLMSLIVIY